MLVKKINGLAAPATLAVAPRSEGERSETERRGTLRRRWRDRNEPICLANSTDANEALCQVTSPKVVKEPGQARAPVNNAARTDPPDFHQLLPEIHAIHDPPSIQAQAVGDRCRPPA